MTLVSMRSDGPRTATTMQNCVAPAVACGVRGVEHLVEVEERVDVDVGGVAARLRAEGAVFRARARLGVDQALELDLGAAVREPHAVGERDEVGELVERERRDREHLVAGERAAFFEQRVLGVSKGIGHARTLDERPKRNAHPPPAGPSPQAWVGGGRVGGLPPSMPGRRRKTRACAPVGWLAVAASDRPTRAAARMSVATLASRGVGFVKVWVIAAVLGTTYLGNTYQASSSVSNVLFELIAAGALSAVLVPTFVDLFRADDDAEAERLASGVLGLALVVMAVVSVIGIVLAPADRPPALERRAEPQVESQQVALSTFFLRFFIPQVLLYAIGTVATAILFAKRRFVIVAVAPIANTVVLVITMVVFRIMHGPTPDLDLTTPEKLVLAIGGHARGARLRGRADGRAPPFRLPPAGHARYGRPQAAPLAVALGVGGAAARRRGAPRRRDRDGQPGRGGSGRVPVLLRRVPRARTRSWRSRSTRRSFPSSPSTPAPGDMATFAGPDPVGPRRDVASAAAGERGVSSRSRSRRCACIAVGNSRSDSDLFAAVLASLGVGLFTYSTFLFFARASYALGDSRTPAIIAGASAVVGAAVMVVGGLTFESDTAKVAALGFGHSSAYLVGSLVLGFVLRRRIGHGFFPHAFLPALDRVGRARRAGLVGGGARRPDRTGRRPPRARGDRARRRRRRTRFSCASCPSGEPGWRPRSSPPIPTSRSNRDPPRHGRADARRQRGRHRRAPGVVERGGRTPDGAGAPSE